MRVLSLCDRTGVAVCPWIDAGIEAHVLDIQHPTGRTSEGLLTLIGMDVRLFEPDPGYGFVFAFPPCTNLANSGARWFKDKGLRGLAQAIELVAACAEICERIGAPYCIENPVGTLSTYWRKPDHMFDPCDYAGYLDNPEPEAYTKRTCLWVGGGFTMPAPRRVKPVLGSKMHFLSPSPNRGDLRSVTPLGWAKAVFEANGANVYV